MQLPKRNPRLADIDGRVPGKVVLVSVVLQDELDPRKGDFQHAYFEEGEDKADPYLRAEGLKLSLENDWPDHEWVIVGNHRAQYLRWVRLQKGMGFLSEEAWSPQAYLDCAP